MEKRTCAGCGVEFQPRKSGKPQKYHSEECGSEHRKAVGRATKQGTKDDPLIVAKCPACGIIYSPEKMPETDADAICARCRVLDFSKKFEAAAHAEAV